MRFQDILVDKSQKLGSGYMADVFVGYDVKEHKKYAVKVIEM